MAEVVSLNAIMLFLKIIVSLLVSVSSSYDSIKTRGTLGFLSNNPPPQFCSLHLKKQISFCFMTIALRSNNVYSSEFSKVLTTVT